MNNNNNNIKYLWFYLQGKEVWQNSDGHREARRCHSDWPLALWREQCCHPERRKSAKKHLRIFWKQYSHVYIIYMNIQLFLYNDEIPHSPVRNRRSTHVIGESGITARHRQQLAYNVHVTMLTGTHEGCGAIIVLQIDLSTATQQSSNHVSSAMTHCQHQSCLPSLQCEKHTKVLINTWLLSSVSVVHLRSLKKNYHIMSDQG